MSESPQNNVPDRSQREKYWNEDYVQYWKKRVQEANTPGANESGMFAGDKKTTTDQLYLNCIGLLQIGKKDRFEAVLKWNR